MGFGAATGFLFGNPIVPQLLQFGFAQKKLADSKKDLAKIPVAKYGRCSPVWRWAVGGFREL